MAAGAWPLLGYQSRTHNDIDVVVRGSDVGLLIEALGEAGFRRAEDGRPFNFLLTVRTITKSRASLRGTSSPSSTTSLEYDVRYAMRNRPRLEVRSDWRYGLESATPEVVTAPAWRSPSRARGRPWSLHPGCLSAI